LSQKGKKSFSHIPNQLKVKNIYPTTSDPLTFVRNTDTALAAEQKLGTLIAYSKLVFKTKRKPIFIICPM